MIRARDVYFAFVLAFFAGGLVAAISTAMGLHSIWGGAFVSLVLTFVTLVNSAKRRGP